MSRGIMCTLLLACGGALPGCEQASAPTETEPVVETPAHTVYPAEVPHEYRLEPVLSAGNTEVWFGAGRGEGRARMSFRANRARQTLELVLRRGSSTVGSTPIGRTEFAHPIPNYGGLIFTTRSITVGSECGHSVEGYGQHAVWNAWLVNWSLFQWGHQEHASQDTADQPQCEQSGGTGGGGYGDDQEECYSCQQWFWMVNGSSVDEWWECDEIDPSNCSD